MRGHLGVHKLGAEHEPAKCRIRYHALIVRKCFGKRQLKGHAVDVVADISGIVILYKLLLLLSEQVDA